MCGPCSIEMMGAMLDQSLLGPAQHTSDLKRELSTKVTVLLSYKAIEGPEDKTHRRSAVGHYEAE